MSKKWDAALAEHMHRLNNPIHDQPKQKWHTGSGIYKVLQPFKGLSAGDNILLENYVHTRVVKLATPTERQVFYPYAPDFTSRMKFTPAEWKTLLRPLTTKRNLRFVASHEQSY